ncbi:MAG: GAF domain-containing protein [Xanthomonadales bacterium]|nr:GAF domain-containing protein [Xanthomonadales bacterium]
MVDSRAPGFAAGSGEGLHDGLHRSLYRIADIASGGRELKQVLGEIHALLSTLLGARNFYVVLLDEDRAHFRFVYFADQCDATPPLDVALPLAQYAHTATVALLRRGRPVQGDGARIAAELGIALSEAPGPSPRSWLGVPMLGADGIDGALVVQDYEAERRFDDHERDLLTFVAQMLQAALERRSLQQRLERRVEERTQALRAEVVEREHAVRLQQALFRIAELAASPIALDAFYKALHGIVGELLLARNFFIVLLDATGEGLYFPYQVDETGDVYQPRRLRRGLSEYLLRSGKPLLLHAHEIPALHASGEVELIGTPSVCWLGVPLRTGERVVGGLVVQSYTPGVTYTDADQALLSFVSVHIASALERRQAQDALRASHAELQATLQRLRETQHDLVEAEKMAALGQLVAGVAHEVNTPLGISITASSALQQRLGDTRKEAEAQRLSRGQLIDFFDYADQAAHLIAHNLQRSAELIRTFKQVAVDRSADDRRRFHLRELLAELLPSLRLLWKRLPVELQVECAEAIELDSFPGALGQVITNFVQNALIHAFGEREHGHMRLSAERVEGGRLILRFADDGAGIPSERLAHIFEPFYTTRRGQGCTGLGLHIVYNLVTEKLGGRIRVDSTPGQGTQFTLDLPLRAP